MLSVKQIESENDIQSVRKLFDEYTSSLGFDLAFQNYDDEYAHLPGEYASPDGRLYLAFYNDELAGCIALRRFDNDVCEMKRLYVRPQFRGHKIGSTLVGKIIEEAKAIGYRAIRLDTIPSMTEARALYRLMGFKEIHPYRYNPIEGAVFVELNLF